MSVPQPLPNLSIASSASRYSRTVDLTDLNSVHTLAVLAVPPGSFVLDIGAADGSVARALTARGCRVWGIEIDPDAARAAERVCERVYCGDVAQVLDAGLDDDVRFDVVLALDVLEHLVDPGAVLAQVAPLIAPGGRLVASIPNVAHGAVRLQLLNGTFTRTGCGLLDETHLHFFDRGSMRALLRDAGFVIRDELRTRRGLTETEIPIDPEGLPGDAVRLATDAVDAETYQFFVIAAPATAGLAQGESLLEILQQRADSFEQQYRRLEGYARNLEAGLADARSRLQAIDEPAIRQRAEADARDQAQRHVAALERHLDHVTRLHAAALDDAVRLREAAVDAAALSRDLADARLARAEAERRADELRTEADAARRDARADLEAARRDSRQALEQAGELRRQLAHLRREISLRDAHVSELRGALDAATAELSALRTQSAQLMADAAEHAAQRDRAVAEISGRLQACDRERAEVQAALDDVRRIPRYRLADAVNSAIKRLPIGHGLLKRLAVSFMRRPRH